MAEADLDSRVRARAFQFLREQTELHGDEVLPRDVLAQGFDFEGSACATLGHDYMVFVGQPRVSADYEKEMPGVAKLNG